MKKSPEKKLRRTKRAGSEKAQVSAINFKTILANEYYAYGTNEENLTDTLANAMHWCDENHVDFKKCLHSAEGHYEAEKGE